MLSHGGSVIPNLSANYRSYDENKNSFYKVGAIFILNMNWWKIWKKPFKYG